jgi:hypothetical protein
MDGGPADETVRFSLGSAHYEIDLSAGQAAEMRADLAPYTGAARRTVQRRRGRRRSTRADLPGIREYAKARGHEINDRGRIPGYIIAEYDALKDADAGR